MVREYNYRKFVQVCAMAQAVIHRPLDCRNRVLTQAISYGICGEQWEGCTNYKHVKCFLKNLKEYHGGCVKVLFGFWFLSCNEPFTARQVNCSTGVHCVKYRL